MTSTLNVSSVLLRHYPESSPWAVVSEVYNVQRKALNCFGRQVALTDSVKKAALAEASQSKLNPLPFHELEQPIRARQSQASPHQASLRFVFPCRRPSSSPRPSMTLAQVYQGTVRYVEGVHVVPCQHRRTVFPGQVRIGSKVVPNVLVLCKHCIE
ncbi:hypothetical protein BD413DRAFT_274791 [Trametes elegans]|nr:hypothetical protein BD413DRAFT_274791 [Trametes elegans]